MTWFGSNPPAGQPENRVQYAHEFQQIAHEFPDDITNLVEKYPLVSLVTTVVAFFFGFVNVFSFSITNIITGAFLLFLSVSFAASITKKGPMTVIPEALKSAKNIYSSLQKPQPA